MSGLPAASGGTTADVQLSLAMEAADLGVWDLGAADGRLTWSPALERMHGLPPGEGPATMEVYARRIHPDDRERVLAAVAHTLASGAPYQVDYRIMTADGGMRTVRARGRLVPDASGHHSRLVGVTLDLTAKREQAAAHEKAEESRRHAEHELEQRSRLAMLARDVQLALTAPGDLPETLQRCAQTVVDHLGAAFARIWTVDDAAQMLELRASAGMYTHLDGPHGRVPIGKFKIGLIAEERRPHLTNEVQGDPRVGDQAWARREGMIAFAGYPLVIGDSLLGVLAMFARRPLAGADFDGLGTVANAIAVGIARARADDETRRNEERYRFLAEAAPTQVWTATATGTLDFANTLTRDYFGVDVQTLAAEQQEALVHPEDRPAVTAKWSAALAAGTPLELEYRLRRHDGEYRWHIMRARPFKDAGGKAIKWFGTNTDIHDAKEIRLTLARRAEELTRVATELEYQRDLTTTIANNTASALFMMDRRGHPLFMNAAACAMTGYSGLDEIKDRPLHYAVHFRKPDGSPYPMEECPIDRANAKTVAMRAQREVFCRKDGTLFHVEYNVAPIGREGQMQGAVIEVRDITADLASQRALRQSDERFHLLARATNDTIWDWDLQAGTVWWNENFATMFGYAMSDLEPGPESWTARLHPDDLSRVVDSIHAAMDGTASTWSDEYRFRRADGTFASILDRGMVVRDDGGRAIRMIGSMMDVTERKRAEAALRRHADELAALAMALQRSNQELDQFAYVASHDLKAPLRGIANLSQWIEEDLGDRVTPEARDHLKLLRSRVVRMEALIDGILAYSRAGRSAGAPEPVAVRRLVGEVAELLAPPAHVQIDIGDLPVLTTERLPLQQVFLNLIGNAVKHAAASPGARVVVGSALHPEGVAFLVSDNGPGIAPAFHEKIWGIFQTLQPRDKVEGTGIGLALVKKIVQNRGGRVWVESDEGAGATFGFTWPAQPEEERA